MYKPLTDVFKSFHYSKWLTVGDGRFGLDSIKIKKIEPSLDILPSDISPHLLEQAKQAGIISNYKVENAEKLSFENNEFDFTFCKESYHHFPRPHIALYEMIRVSKKGVVLIEPNEIYPLTGLQLFLYRVKSFLKKIIGKPIHHTDYWRFEDSGNYVYAVSKREIEKIALGIQLPTIALYYFNDYYEAGVEHEEATSNSVLFKKVKRKIKWADIKSKYGLQKYSGIIAIIFKEKPSTELEQKMKKNGFEVIHLPSNPYLPK